MSPPPNSTSPAEHQISIGSKQADSCWELIGAHHDQTDPYLYWDYIVTLWRHLESHQVAATLSYTPRGKLGQNATSAPEPRKPVAGDPSRPQLNLQPTIATTTLFASVNELIAVFASEPSLWHGGRPSDVPDGALHYPRLAACRIAAAHAPESSHTTAPTRDDVDPRIGDGLRWHRASETIFHHYRDLYTIYASWCATVYRHDARRLHPRAMGVGFNIAARQLANTPRMRAEALPVEQDGLIPRAYVIEALIEMLTSPTRRFT